MRNFIVILAAFAIAVVMAGQTSAETMLYLRFDNDGKTAGQVVGTDSVLDETANDNDGTASGTSGATAVYTSDVFGSFVPLTGSPNGLALDFERDNKQILTVADDDSLDFGPTDAFTLEAWVKLETLASDVTESNYRRQYVMHKKSSAGLSDNAVNYALLAASEAGSGLRLQLGNGTANTYVGSSLGITDYDWHYISVAFDPVNDVVRFVLDDATQTINGITFAPAANDGELTIGGHYPSSGTLEDWTFDGMIDEIRISSGFLAEDDLLVNAVPEPSSWALTAIGLLGLAAGAMQRRRWAGKGSED